MANDRAIAVAGVSRKRQLLFEAAKLFSEQGYLATGMRDIALAVGIEPGSIYSHYKSKDDLLWNLAIECSQAFEAEVLKSNQSSTDPQQQLASMIAAHIQVVIAHQSAAAIFLQEWKHLAEPRRTEYSQLRSVYESSFQEVIESGQEQGVFRQTDSKLVTLALLSSLNWLSSWYRTGGPLSQQQVAANLTELFLHGILQQKS